MLRPFGQSELIAQKSKVTVVMNLGKAKKVRPGVVMKLQTRTKETFRVHSPDC